MNPKSEYYDHAASLLYRISKLTQQAQQGKYEDGWEPGELSRVASQQRKRVEQLGGDLEDFGIAWRDDEPIRPDGKAE